MRSPAKELQAVNEKNLERDHLDAYWKVIVSFTLSGGSGSTDKISWLQLGCGVQECLLEVMTLGQTLEVWV